MRKHDAKSTEELELKDRGDVLDTVDATTVQGTNSIPSFVERQRDGEVTSSSNGIADGCDRGGVIGINLEERYRVASRLRGK